jgi:hypothetical protein
VIVAQLLCLGIVFVLHGTWCLDGGRKMCSRSYLPITCLCVCVCVCMYTVCNRQQSNGVNFRQLSVLNAFVPKLASVLRLGKQASDER